EIVSTDWRPMAEVIYAKQKGKDAKENQIINLEDFIAIKGIKAIGNQLTVDKIKQVNLLEPLLYEAPEEVHADELEVVDEETVLDGSSPSTDSNKENDEITVKDDDEEGQTTLF